MGRFQRCGGVVLLVLWGLAPALHLHHLLEHHMPAHAGGHSCSHHADHGAQNQVPEHEAGFYASDACDLCEWQWAPAGEADPFVRITPGQFHNVEGKLGLTSPALGDDLAQSDLYRRGPPDGISLG